MDMIVFKLKGFWCNEWPLCEISLNNQVYFNGQVKDDIEVSIQSKFEEVNFLELKHYGKRFGDNGIWDTTETADRAIKVVSVVINDIDITDIFYKIPFETADETQHTHYLGHNGVWKCEIPNNVYTWIIQHRHVGQRLAAPNLVVETSHSDLFDYSRDLEELEELEQLIKQYAHIVDKSSATRSP